MGRLIFFGIIIWLIYSGTKNSNSSYNSTPDGNKKSDLIKKFGERDKSKNLVERNYDIILTYCSEVTTMNKDTCVCSCYNDICKIEGLDSKILKRNYDKPDIGTQERELYDTIKNMVDKRWTVNFKGINLGTQKLLITQDITKEIEWVKKDYNTIYGAISNSFDDVKVNKNGFYYTSNGNKDTDYLGLLRPLFEENRIFYNQNFRGGIYDLFEYLPRKKYDFIKADKFYKDFICFGDYVDNILISIENDDFFAEDASGNILKNSINKAFGLDKGRDGFVRYSDDCLYLEKDRELIEKISDNIDEIYSLCEKHAKSLIKKLDAIISEHNEIVNSVNQSYSKGEDFGITKKVEAIIENLFDKYCCGCEVGYDNVSKNLIIEYHFPSIDDLPRLKEHKVKGNDSMYSDSAMKKLYDKYMYSICIKTLYNVYDNDEKGFIKGIVFNGIVTSIDKRFGNERTDCILTISTEKDDLKDIILENIDPRETFKALRGVSAASLSSLTPVPPISTLNRDDKRFVEGYNVIDSLNDSVNIACMDWQDFENLIRDLFEKIYGEKGGEVKVTQASRDGGVDAVAFDPDPVTGGKILIQAKRYTNVVGVGAVRDLAGAVHHEGAMKGILVTTSNFGSDAMKFVAKEPISLINGQNLLSLLNRYGYHAHIDIKEARKILKEQEKSSN